MASDRIVGCFYYLGLIIIGMNDAFSLDKPLVAPCGINCSVCRAYLRDKNHCPGCWDDSTLQPRYCTRCIIRNCSYLKETPTKFCCDCPKYPCLRLRQLEKRYRLKYRTSIIENLQVIMDKGLSLFLEKEKEKWKCSRCGGMVCIHTGNCIKCNAPLFS